MQWLSLVTEDNGVQRLKADNKKPAITGNVDAVSPYPSTHATRIGDGTGGRQRQPGRERRQDERRNGGERRREQVPVLLDTRARHDRRGIENRRKSDIDETATQVPRTRVNLYA